MQRVVYRSIIGNAIDDWCGRVVIKHVCWRVVETWVTIVTVAVSIQPRSILFFFRSNIIPFSSWFFLIF